MTAAIAQATIDRVLANTRVALPGAIDSTILVELFNVVKDLFDRSDIWNLDFNLTLVPGQVDYDVSGQVPVGARIARVVAVFSSAGSRKYARIVLPATLRIGEIPASDDTVMVTLSFVPNDPVDATSHLPQVPDELVVRYRDGIEDGIKGRMMMQPAKTYTSDTLGLFHWRRFNSAVAIAKAETMHGFAFAGQSWFFPQTHSTRRNKNR